MNRKSTPQKRARSDACKLELLMVHGTLVGLLNVVILK